MATVSGELRQRLRTYGQEHVLAWWDRLSEQEQQELLDQLEKLDLEQLRQLYARKDQVISLPPPDRIVPIPVSRLKEDDYETLAQGEEALRRGEVAVLLVAGGQGSRLGFEHPKGMFPIGPVSNKSLFQIHAEKVLALGRRYGKPVPFLIMTSPSNHAESRSFFDEHRLFGLSSEEVHFFNQGAMPALDLDTGKLLMEGPGRLFTSPNGHGGTLLALAETGLLDRLKKRGIRHVFYFQVDNPLIKIAQPLFLGHHRSTGAEVSSKVIPKNKPGDKLGVLVSIDGRCSIIEYSDLPKEMAHQVDPPGRLRFWAGSPAIHIFDVDFLDRVTRAPRHESPLTFHIARKKVAYLDAAGTLVEPAKENALKFEMFIFDVLPHADRWTVVETSRAEEFEPVKNATGPDSPASARQAISNLAGSWLEKARVAVPRRPDGNVAVPLEISPLLALDASELASKIGPDFRITGPTYLGDG